MANPILTAKLAPIAYAHDRYQLRRSQAFGWLCATVVGVLLLLVNRQFNISIPWQLPLLIVAAFGYGLFLRIRARGQRTDLHTLARNIEHEHPDLHALLLTAMDAEPDAETKDFSYLQKRVIREALSKNLRDPWDQRGNERLFFTQAFHLLSVVAFIIVALALGSIKPIPGQPTRKLFAGEIDVKPGDTTLERGSSVVVTATFGNRVPNEATLVLLPSNGGTRRLPLKRNLQDPVFGTSLMSVDTDTLYYIEYGDDRTKDYRLQVFDYPALMKSDAELDYPAYTKLPNRVIKDTHRVTAVEGTKLTYTMFLNKPITAGSLVGRDGAVVDLKPDTTRTNTYLAKFSLEKSNTYELSLKDADSRTNKLSADFVIRVKQNQMANLKLKSPVGDQRFSAVEEVEFEGEVWDDYGMGAYGFAYAIGAEEPVLIEHGQASAAKEKHHLTHLLEIEDFDIAPKSLITYYLWADDIGPDGEVRRNYSDMFFAEIRPFEEIFRENQSGQQQNQQSGIQGNSPAMELAELQKEIINATWNIQRRESGRKPSTQFVDDVHVVLKSQSANITQLEQVAQEIPGEREQAILQQAKAAMEQTLNNLSDAMEAKSPQRLPLSIATARSAYHYLLQVQPEEFQLSQSQGSSGGGGRSQQQLNQLEMTNDADRYETQSEAASQQDQQQNEQLQILNRLKELARRQQDLNRRLQELQTALNETETEEEKEDIEQQLKRLRDQQREMLEDMDELRQRVANQNTPETAESLSQLDQIRNQAQEAAESLEDRQVSQALASGTRTQQDLEELRDDYRRENSGQFSQAMQDLRTRAHQLTERQDEIRDDLSAATQNDQKSLAESEEASRVMENVEQQKEELQSLLDDVRSISEDSETAEPLLSRQLYETYRATDPTKISEQLDYTSQLARLNLIDKAQEFEAQTHESIDELKDRIDRAAESVLGDGVESLRRARLALDELLEDVENEIASHLPSDEQTSPQGYGEPSENETHPGQGSPTKQERQMASNQSDGQQPGQAENDHQPGESQSESPTSQGKGRSTENVEQEESPHLAQRGSGEQSGNPQQRQGGGGGQRQSLRTAWNIGVSESNLTGGSSGDGPLTGRDFSEFSDRLREVEEMIDVPDLQNEVAVVRDRARAMRIDYKRHGKEPQWDLVQMKIEKPLAEIRQQVGEELARRLSQEAVVPIDRDPVPQKYSELVRRYYEALSDSE